MYSTIELWKISEPAAIQQCDAPLRRVRSSDYRHAVYARWMLCQLATVRHQDTLSAQQRRGKQIYLQGTSPSGKRSYIGDASLEVPRSAMACVIVMDSMGEASLRAVSFPQISPRKHLPSRTS